MNSLVFNKSRNLAKEYPTFTTLIWLFPNVNFLVNKSVVAAEGFPTRATLIKPFFRADTLILNKFMVVAGSFFIFTPLVMSFSIMKGLPTLTITVCLHIVRSGLVLDKT